MRACGLTTMRFRIRLVVVVAVFSFFKKFSFLVSFLLLFSFFCFSILVSFLFFFFVSVS
jgi:hypothetical protein